MNIDVFVSHHTSSSLHIVEGIVNRLESSGLKCWYAPRNTQGHYADSITEAIDTCEVFLLVLNKPASESFHVLNELELVCDRLIKGESVHVVPFHVGDAEISRKAQYYIKRMHWIEAIDPPIYERIDELVAHINTILGRSVPARVESGAAKPAVPQYRLVPKMPQPRDVFHGREDLLQKIDDVFSQGKNALFLEGIGGIGKSELAKQYALRHRGDYDTVVFATYTTSLEKLMNDATSIVIEGIEPQAEETESAFFARKLQVLHSIANERTLLIIDNFDVDGDPRLKEFLSGSCRTIFTTRNAHPGYTTLKVEAIRDKAVLMDIFEQNYGMSVEEEERPAVEAIFELVEYHTYAVELIAKQMEASFLSASGMLEMLRSGGMETSGQEMVSGRNDYRSAFGHICSVFNIGRLGEEEQRLMRYLSLAGTRGMPAVRFKEWAGLETMDAVNGLLRRSWIRREAGGYISLHPLVREVMVSMLKPDVENCLPFLRRVADFCYHAWFRPYRENLAVGDCIFSFLQSLSGPNETEWYAFSCFPNFLWQIGRFDDSIYYGNRMYKAIREIYGEASMITGFAAKALAGCYFNAGRQRESIAYYRQGLESMLRSGEPESEDLAMSYEKVARCYSWEYEQDLEKSEELFHKGLEIRLRLLEQLKEGKTPAFLEQAYQPYNVTLALSRIGESYMEMGRLYQIREEYEKAAEYAQLYLENLQENTPGNISAIAYAHYDLGVCRYHLALRQREAGNESACMEELARAEAFFRSALETNMKMRGALALDTIDNQEYLADTLAAKGDRAAASNEYMAVITMVEGLLGPRDPRIESVKKKMTFSPA